MNKGSNSYYLLLTDKPGATLINFVFNLTDWKRNLRLFISVADDQCDCHKLFNLFLKMNVAILLKIAYAKIYIYQRWSRGHEAKAKDTKKSEAKAKDSLSKDRHSRGQGQECSRPRTKDTSASALRKKKKVFIKIFKRSPQKNVFQKIFQALHKILTIQKIVLSSSRGQDNFRGLEASRPRPRT